jgi:WD40 repeat protein
LTGGTNVIPGSRLVATALASAAVVVAAGSAPPRTSAAPAVDRILLASNRDGLGRAYSVRRDGSRLTPLLPRSRPLDILVVSADGGTVAYAHPGRFGANAGIDVSRADGTGLRRVVRERVYDVALSRDGRLLAFTTAKPGIWIVGSDGRGRRRFTGPSTGSPAWSPDGRTLAFVRGFGDAEALVVQPLRGSRRVLGRGTFRSPRWSPDGRWIAYTTEEETLWIVRADARGRRRIARTVEGYSWSPDSRRLAYSAHYGEDVAVVGLDGHGRRLDLRLDGTNTDAPAWSRDGRRLAFATGYPSQVWVVGRDGRGLRRVTSRGSNYVIGWTQMTPVLRTARPVPPTERAVSGRALALRARATELAADGGRVAFAVGSTGTDCHHVAVWTPTSKSIARFVFPAPCGDLSSREDLGRVALAGRRTAWLHTSGGNTVEQEVLVNGRQVASFYGDEANGNVVDRIVGDGGLLVFSVQRHCDQLPGNCPPASSNGGVSATTIYGVEVSRSRPAAITKAAGAVALLAVDAGRIVVGTETEVRVVDARGRALRAIPVRPDAAALSGDRLAVRVSGGVEVYDVPSGMLVARFAQLGRLVDLESDVLVTAKGGEIELRRLSNGRSLTIRASGGAQLERPGLFVADGRRITFTPMAEILRRLGG